jgi:hypothetical protein
MNSVLGHMVSGDLTIYSLSFSIYNTAQTRNSSFMVVKTVECYVPGTELSALKGLSSLIF